MPTVGATSPQGKDVAGTAVPTLVCHRTPPSLARKAYIESFSVATYTVSPNTNGEV